MKILGFNISSARFGGIQNYIDVFTQPNMRGAILNSFIFALITTIFKMVFGLTLAVALNQKLALTNALRTIFFLPAVINTVAVGLIFSSLMHPTNGLINGFLNAAGLGGLAQSWLIDTNIAIFSICAIEDVYKRQVVTLIISAMSAYAISRMIWKGREITLKIILMGMMVPIHAALLPLFIILSKTHLLNSYASLIIPVSYTHLDVYKRQE